MIYLLGYQCRQDTTVAKMLAYWPDLKCAICESKIDDKLARWHCTQCLFDCCVECERNIDWSARVTASAPL